MIRQDLISLLSQHPWTLSELARRLKKHPREVEEDLYHLHRSLKRSNYQLRVRPASCKKCGFVFSARKLSKPGKCPKCHSTWIDEPLVEIVLK